MRVTTKVLTLVAAGLVVAVMARPMAQGGGGQRAGAVPSNIKVLPKDWTRQQVTQFMQAVAPALGVQCDHCHVSTTDRASDAKPTKLIARKMIEMVMDINEKYLKDVGEPPVPGANKVTCYTCHRGTLKPLTAKPAGGN